MIEEFEALSALRRRGTMVNAAGFIGVTQSAISKRIASLEERTGRELIERDGRRVRLTAYGERLLNRVEPVLSDLRQIIHDEDLHTSGVLTLTVSRVWLATWGAKSLKQSIDKFPDVELEMIVRGGPGTIENVRSGESMAGVMLGDAGAAEEFEARTLLEEEMVIVPSLLERFCLPKRGELEVLTMSPSWESNRTLFQRIKRREKKWGFSLVPSRQLLNSNVAVELAREGFGHALVPISVADAASIPRRALVALPKPALTVPTTFIARRSVFSRPIIQQFLAQLERSIPKKARTPL